VEVAGGLYHVITRGNDRQDIFHSGDDHKRFISLLAKQKERSGFYLYAYCLMTNHLHPLIERQAETVGRSMQRILTGYSQYYNRRYRRVGHVFQGRHKAILCQSEGYLGKLVRYIHLNPVRAKMVAAAEEYPYSSHRAYLDLEPAGIVDVDPVLMLFGGKREAACKVFAQWVAAAYDEDESTYSWAENDILGSEEFVDAYTHRLGDVDDRKVGPTVKKKDERPLDPESLISAVEAVLGISRTEFYGSGKSAQAVMAKELITITGRDAGASFPELSKLTGLDASTVSRRYEAARKRVRTDAKLASAKELVAKRYRENIAILHV
jgi:REP element-mobilizing transposase RayT